MGIICPVQGLTFLIVRFLYSTFDTNPRQSLMVGGDVFHVHSEQALLENASAWTDRINELKRNMTQWQYENLDMVIPGTLLFEINSSLICCNNRNRRWRVRGQRRNVQASFPGAVANRRPVGGGLLSSQQFLHLALGNGAARQFQH